jgi:hypothetical protein
MHGPIQTREKVPLKNKNDKKENRIFLIYKEIQNGALAKSYMTNRLLIYGAIFAHFLIYYTVKKVDEVARHPHLVAQDQFTQLSKKVSDIPEENFTKNIEVFRQTFTNVELLRQMLNVSKLTSPGREPWFSD